MSFKRSVNRNKTLTFTHQEKKQSDFEANFHLRWIPFQMKSLVYICLIFLFHQIVTVSLLHRYMSYQSALVVTHGVISSLCIVSLFTYLAHKKISIQAFLIRFIFCMLMFGGFVFALTLFS